MARRSGNSKHFVRKMEFSFEIRPKYFRVVSLPSECTNSETYSAVLRRFHPRESDTRSVKVACIDSATIERLSGNKLPFLRESKKARVVKKKRKKRGPYMTRRKRERLERLRKSGEFQLSATTESLTSVLSRAKRNVETHADDSSEGGEACRELSKHPTFSEIRMDERMCASVIAQDIPERYRTTKTAVTSPTIVAKKKTKRKKERISRKTSAEQSPVTKRKRRRRTSRTYSDNESAGSTGERTPKKERKSKCKIRTPTRGEFCFGILCKEDVSGESRSDSVWTRNASLFRSRYSPVATKEKHLCGNLLYAATAAASVEGGQTTGLLFEHGSMKKKPTPLSRPYFSRHSTLIHERDDPLLLLASAAIK